MCWAEVSDHQVVKDGLLIFPPVIIILTSGRHLVDHCDRQRMEVIRERLGTELKSDTNFRTKFFKAVSPNSVLIYQHVLI